MTPVPISHEDAAINVNFLWVNKVNVKYRISWSLIRLIFFPFQNNPKNLDPSYKTDLDLWNSLGKVKLVFQQNFIRLIELFLVILERGKTHLIAE